VILHALAPGVIHLASTAGRLGHRPAAGVDRPLVSCSDCADTTLVQFPTADTIPFAAEQSRGRSDHVVHSRLLARQGVAANETAVDAGDDVTRQFVAIPSGDTRQRLQHGLSIGNRRQQSIRRAQPPVHSAVLTMAEGGAH